MLKKILTVREKEVFELLILGKTTKEIAKILNLTEEQVKVNLFRARQKVKQRYLEIDEYGL